MTRQGENIYSQSSPPKRPEQYRPSVSRLKVGETLQPIRRTAQELYLFRDNVGGRSALVHDSDPGELHDYNGRQRRGTTKSPGYANHGGQKTLGSGESHHIKIHQRRRSGVEVEGEGASSHTQRSHFRVSIKATGRLVASSGILANLALKSIEVPTFLAINAVKPTAQSGALVLKVQERSATSADSSTQSKKATGDVIDRKQERQESIGQCDVSSLLSFAPDAFLFAA